MTIRRGTTALFAAAMLYSGVASTSAAADATAASTGIKVELDTLTFPDDGADIRQVRPYNNAVQGVFELRHRRSFTEILSGHAEVALFQDSHGASHIDGEAWLRRDGEWTITAGLLRERWGRETGSELDVLTAPITVFTLVDDHGRVAQPGAHLSTQKGPVRIDVHALAGRRAQPVPDTSARLGFGFDTREQVQSGRLGRSAFAVRASGAVAAFDWAVHAYTGLSRSPVFVPRFEPTGVTVALAYDDITQFGAEIETTAGPFRLWAEGFHRNGGRRVDGTRANWEHVAAAAEHQAFGAFRGRFDMFTELKVTFDSRGARADRPFQSSARLAWNLIGTSEKPFEIEAAVLHDLEIDGRGMRFAVHKQVSSAPLIKAGLEFMKFERGNAPGLLDIFEHDTRLALKLSWEI